jgi:hypothetical protein
MEANFKRLVQGLNPWAPLFAFVALFQFMRGANFDAIYFCAVVALLIIQSKGSSRFVLPDRPRFKSLTTILFLLAFGILLFLVPRRSSLEVALMISILLIAFTFAWHRDPESTRNKTGNITKAAWLWAGLAISTSLWELSAYVLSDLVKDPYAFPTISVLMKPFMETSFGRASFLAIWLVAGWALLLRNRR